MYNLATIGTKPHSTSHACVVGSEPTNSAEMATGGWARRAHCSPQIGWHMWRQGFKIRLFHAQRNGSNALASKHSKDIKSKATSWYNSYCKWSEYFSGMDGYPFLPQIAIEIRSPSLGYYFPAFDIHHINTQISSKSKPTCLGAIFRCSLNYKWSEYFSRKDDKSFSSFGLAWKLENHIAYNISLPLPPKLLAAPSHH